MRAVAAAALSALFATGCASPALVPAARPAEPAVIGRNEASRGASESPDAAGPSAASVALLDQSRAARERGDLMRAAAIVERALSIDPNDASLWIELAEIRFAQGDRDEAETLARKALTLAGNDRSIAPRAARLGAR